MQNQHNTSLERTAQCTVCVCAHRKERALFHLYIFFGGCSDFMASGKDLNILLGCIFNAQIQKPEHFCL